MSSTAVADPEATPRVERVEDLPDPDRQAIVAARETGSTLAEIKKAFPHVAPDVIPEVLPPASKREAKQREVRTPKDRPAAQPEPAEAKDEPKVDPQVAANLAERIVAARELPGASRSVVAALTGLTPGKVWRVEQGRVRPDEVAQVTEALDALERNGLPEEYRPKERPAAVACPTKAELVARVEAAVEFLRKARDDRSIAKAALVDTVLAYLDPRPTE